MNKGGYLGGNTIVTAWGGGWSRDAQTSRRTPAKKAKPYQEQFGEYCRNCAISTKKGEPWPRVPPVIFNRFNGKELELRAAVLTSAEYAASVSTKKKSRKTGRKFSALKTDGFAKFVRNCAVADRNKKPWPLAPKKFMMELPPTENGIKDFIRKHPEYRKAPETQNDGLSSVKSRYAARLRQAAQAGRTIVPPPGQLKRLLSKTEMQKFIQNNYSKYKKAKD